MLRNSAVPERDSHPGGALPTLHGQGCAGLYEGPSGRILPLRAQVRNPPLTFSYQLCCSFIPTWHSLVSALLLFRINSVTLLNRRGRCSVVGMPSRRGCPSPSTTGGSRTTKRLGRAAAGAAAATCTPGVECKPPAATALPSAGAAAGRGYAARPSPQSGAAFPKDLKR